MANAHDVVPSLLNHPYLSAYSEQPWRAITDLPQIIDAFTRTAGQAISPTAWVHPSAVVVNSFVASGARLYEGVTVRDSVILENTTVGHCSEVARSLVMQNGMLPRFNYLGSSLLGAGVELGGTVMMASHRHDWGPPLLHWGNTPFEVDSPRMGAIVGDECIIAYGSHLNPGSVIGKGTLIRTHVDVAGYIPPNSIVRVRQRVTVLGRRPLPRIAAADQRSGSPNEVP